MIASAKRNVGAWATGGAVVAAVLSSACCWLPLLLIGLGTSAVGVAGFFEAYRLYLLGATALLLAAGFYLVYFRKQRCDPGGACAVPNPRLARFNKVMLWVATGLVLLFALFPNYVGMLTGGGEEPPAATLSGESRVYRIEGMTCEGCATNLRRSLSGVPGIAHAEVSYSEKTARVFFEESAPPPTDGTIRKAIEEAGYRSRGVKN
ncbi:MAG: mercuric transporter MerT family protein [Planctomycetota bacterium]